jgi:hypothetical protein
MVQGSSSVCVFSDKDDPRMYLNRKSAPAESGRVSQAPIDAWYRRIGAFVPICVALVRMKGSFSPPAQPGSSHGPGGQARFRVVSHAE